jgi:hypothetical protein
MHFLPPVLVSLPFSLVYCPLAYVSQICLTSLIVSFYLSLGYMVSVSIILLKPSQDMSQAVLKHGMNRLSIF